MSELNVDTIKKADGTGNLSVPAETGTVVTTASPSLGRRNLIINGAMQVAQRSTSFTATGGSFQYGWVDRWKTSYEVNATYSQVDADVDGYGGKATRIAPTGASTQYAFQVIENPRSIASKKFTVSWWAKASGTFAQYIYVRRGGGGDLYFDPSFTNVTTDWQRFSVTVTGLEATALADGTNLDILIGFTSTGSSDTYDLTMVQVEEGSVATPFEHRSYGEELTLCERYYQLSGGGCGVVQSSTRVYLSLSLRTEMRATPTLGQTEVIQVNDGSVNSSQSSADIRSYDPDKKGSFLELNNFSGLTTGRPALLRSVNADNITFDAEL